MSRGTLALLVAGLAALASAPAAGAADWIPARTLSAATDGDGSEPAAAIDADGDQTLAWVREDAVGDRHIEAQRVAVTGQRGPVLTLTAPGDSGSSPVSALGPDGSATVVWQESGEVQLRRIEADGALGPLRTLSALGSAQHAKVVMAPNGIATVAWSRTLVAGASVLQSVHLRRIDPVGTMTPIVDLDTPVHLGGDALIDLAVDGSGATTALWRRTAGGNFTMYTRRVAENGVLGPTNTVDAVDSTTVFPLDGRLALRASGAGVVVWNESSAGGVVAPTLARPVAPDGALGPVDVVSAPAAMTQGPRADVAADGTATVVWQGGLGIDGARIPPGGAAGDPFPVSASPGGSPGMGVTSAGTAFVVWSDSSPGVDALHSRTIDPSGALGGLAVLTETGEDVDDQDVAVGPDGDALALWIRADTAPTQARAALYDVRAPSITAFDFPSTVPTGVPFAARVTAIDGGAGVASYAWTFGDGATATGPAVAHAYGTTGTFPIGVTVTDGVGNASGLSRTAAAVSVGVGTPPPPPPPPPVVAPKATAKLAIARARVVRKTRRLDVLAPITALASGRVDVDLHSAGRHTRSTAPVDPKNRRIRFTKKIPQAQANLGTGIVTITYKGDADTRPQEVRLRAASQPARLTVERPTLKDGRLRTEGTVTSRARGAVRVQLEWASGGETRTLESKARIRDGKWALDERLPAGVVASIAARSGTVQSSTLFTGYFPRRVRGEMRAYQVLGPP